MVAIHKRGRAAAIKAYEKMVNSERVVSGEYTVVSTVDEYKGNKVPITFIHNTCGHEYQARPNDFTYGKSCPKCANKIRSSHINTSDPTTYLERVIVKGYTWLEEYKGDNKIKHSIRHEKCGYEYTVRPNDFQQGYRCPECSNGCLPSESRNAKRISDYLEKWNFDFHKEFIDKRCKSDRNGQLRFDFAIEHEPNMYIIIEYDGELHTGDVYGGDIPQEWVANTIRCDKIKDQFVKDHPEKYKAMHRITHKQPLRKTLEKILRMYYDF